MPVIWTHPTIPDCVCRIECWHGDICLNSNTDTNPKCLCKIEYEVVDELEGSKNENPIPVERTADEETGDNKC